MAAPVFCLGLLLGVIAGELVVRGPRTPVRAASIRVRRAVDYLPRRLTAGVATGSVAVAIVRRPGPADLEDDARRSVSAEVVLGALGILVAVPAIGVSAVAAGKLLTFPCPAPWWTLVGWLLVAAMLGWLALLVGSIASFIAPRNPVLTRESP